jgi:hypothetical protein
VSFPAEPGDDHTTEDGAVSRAHPFSRRIRGAVVERAVEFQTRMDAILYKDGLG